MNRSIKQEISRRNIRASHHPIGDRRGNGGDVDEREIAEQPDTSAPAQDDGQRMPYWSAYLTRLGAQVKHSAAPKNWLGFFLRKKTPQSQMPPYQHRHHSGDRRKSVEERRKLVMESYPPELERRKAPEFIEHLGEAPAAKPKRWWNPFAGLRGPTKNVEAVELQPTVMPLSVDPEERPIGNRRTHPGDRRRSGDRGYPQAGEAKSERQDIAALTLGSWSYYFVAKLGMFWMDLIAFHTLENLAFVVFILFFAKYLGKVKGVVITVLALTLLYYDSWLPPIDRVISQASLLSNFSIPYFIELLERFVNWSVIGVLFAATVVFRVLARWIRIDSVVVVAMLAVGVFQILPLAGGDNTIPDMDKVLQDFFAKEAQRSVVFDMPQQDEVPFDVIFIHVCSLSWDDVEAVGLDQHPLWQHFDMLLTRFNSAASYSGPAAIHLLRGKCGQPEHGKMYLPTAEKCYLMNSLQVSGFEENVVLNHNGKFDDFLGQLKKYGDLQAPPLALDGLTPAQYAFDKSPVFDDTDVLDRWLEQRQKSDSARVAMYYNTVSMHDGNHLSGNTSIPNTLDSYRERLAKFLDELDAFLKKLDKSGRRAVVVMVPEHGAAVRGDKMQIAGLREIPTPAITIVPVGIRVVGGNLRHDESTLKIDQPTSYLAISQIVARMLQKSPFDSDSFSASDYAKDLPTTEFVAQDEKITVAEYKHKFYLNRGKGKWEAYSEFNKPAGGQ